MEPRGTCITLLLLIVVTGRITAILLQCPKDGEAVEGACLLLAPGRMDWESAHHFCRRKGGFLIGHEDITQLEVTQLIPGKVTWTALGPHEGNLQWMTERPVMATDVMWIKKEEGDAGGQKCGFLQLASQLLQPISCSTLLPFACRLTSPVEETYTDVTMELQMKVDGGGASGVEKEGWVTVTEKVLQQLSLTCTAHLSPSGDLASSQPRVFWSKDGVYLPVYNPNLAPVNDVGTFTQDLLQGTYWCEAWLPHSSARLVSNKVLLTLAEHEVLLLYLQDRQYPQSPPITTDNLKEKVREAFSLTDVKSTINVVSIVKEYDAGSYGSLVTSRVQVHFPPASSADFASLLRMLHEERDIENLLERKGFLVTSTASLPTRCRSRTDVAPGGNTVTWPFSEVGKVQPLHYRCEAAGGGLLEGHCRWNYTHGATVHFDRRECQRFDFCPRDYTGLAGAFCVSRTSASTWEEGFHAAYMSKNTMSLLDAAQLLKDREVLLFLYQEVQRWLEDGEGDGRLWLPARRLAPFAPIVVLSPGSATQYSSNSRDWLRIYNVSWDVEQPSPEQDCLALDTKASVLLTLPCDDVLPFLSILDVRELLTVPRKDTPPYLIINNKPLCPGWWGSEYPGGQGTCFKLFTSLQGVKWNKAEELCVTHGADLPDPSDGFLDWSLRQYLYNRKIQSVWIRFPPRETEGKSGTFLNWRANNDLSLPHAALTPSGWERQDHDVTKTSFMCQKSVEVPKMTMAVFEETGNIRVTMQLPSKSTMPQCYVNGRTVSVSEIKDTLTYDDEEYGNGELEFFGYDDEEYDLEYYLDSDLGIGEYDSGDFHSEDKSYVMDVNSDTQGYYECMVWTDSPFHLVKSNVLLYRRPNTLTFSIILDRKNQYTPMLHDATIEPQALSPSDTCVSSYLSSIQQILDSIPIKVTTDNFYFLSETQTNALLHHFHVNLEFVNGSIAMTESEAFGTVADALDRLSNWDCHGVSVRSTFGCYRETQRYNNVTLTWPATQGAAVMLPAELCVTDKGDPVIRECLGDFITGYRWGNKSGECTDQPRNVTRQLWKINQVSSPSDPELLAALTDPRHSLTTVDLHFTALKMKYLSRESSVPPRAMDHIVETLNNVMEVRGEVFQQLHGVLNTSSILLQAFKSISFKMKLPRNSIDQVVKSDSKLVSLARVSAVPHSSIIGYHSWMESKDEEEEENVMRQENKDDWKHSKVTLILPDGLTQRVGEEDGIHRVQIMFAVYRNAKLFHDNSSFHNHTVDGHIIQAAYGGRTITHLQKPVKIYFKKSSVGNSSKCVFWDFGKNEGRGGWSTEGCWSDGRHGGHVLCLCTHLTCFAHLVNFDEEVVGGVHEIILDTISIIGCTLSIFSLLLVLVTFFLFKKWRRRLSNQILVNLAFAILCSLSVFLAGIEQTLFPVVCRGVAVALHYFILASFGWMLVEAVHQYLRLVKVLGTYIPRFIWKACLGAWGVPLLPIIVVLIYDTSLYDSDTYLENRICWMSSTVFKYAFLPPLAVTMATNLVLFVLIIHSTTCGRVRVTSTLSERQLRLTQLQMAISVFSLLGFTWVFGLLSFWKPSLVFSYLFCFTNTTQGFFIFLFHVFRERDARKLWQDFLSVISRKSGTSEPSTSPVTSKTSEQHSHSTPVTA